MKKILMIAITSAVILALYSVSPYAKKEEKTMVQIIQPEVNAIQDMITLHGSVIDPHRNKLYPTGASYVRKIYVSEGEFVKAGQLLMKLEKADQRMAEESTAVSALVELKDTLETGAIQDAETMLEDMISAVSTPAKSESDTYYSLFSPCDGMVMKLTAQEGASVSGLLPCVEITRLDHLQIEVAAGEDVIGLLKPQMNCTIDVPAFSLEQVPGIVNKIDPYAKETNLLTGNTATQTNVYITPTQFTDNLRPGYRVSAKIIVSTRLNALLLPYESILQDEEGKEYVLKVEDDRIVKANILTGSELESQVEICEGLDDNTWILRNPKAEWEGEALTIVLP